MKPRYPGMILFTGLLLFFQGCSEQKGIFELFSGTVPRMEITGAEGSRYTDPQTLFLNVKGQVAEVNGVVYPLDMISDDQERIRVRLLRRSFERKAVVSRLVDFQVTGIPPGPARERQVEVTLRAKKESLTIYAVEKETGTPVKIRTILFIGE